MTTSLSARHHEDNPAEVRLRGLSRQQLADRLNWLSWYQPGIFTAVMDYMEFSENLAADTDLTNPDPDPGEPGYGEAPAPVCGSAACSRVM
jgi:hypothetical protein